MPQLNNNQHVRQLANLELLARQVVEGFITGLHQSPFHGFSVEFAEHRLYNNGESVKNIDWKLLARTDKLFVKQFEEETNLRCYLLLDTSSSMNFPAEGINKLQFSVYAIASLMYLFKKQRDAFGLCLFSDKMDWMSPARSTSAHLFYLYAQLEKAYNNPKAKYSHQYFGRAAPSGGRDPSALHGNHLQRYAGEQPQPAKNAGAFCCHTAS
jgi:uncharacterized protein (DUF58 family)